MTGGSRLGSLPDVACDLKVGPKIEPILAKQSARSVIQ